MLKFKRMSIDDQEKLRIWRTMPETSKFLLTDPKITAEEQMKWYESVKDGKKYKCWIISSDGVDIGFVNLADFDLFNKRADPGIFICEKKFQGKGFAKHILMNLLRHAFEDLKLHKLYGPIVSANSSAVAAYLKSGFYIEGYFKDHLFKNGRYWDLIFVAINENTWAEIKQNIEYIFGEFESY